MAPVLKEAALRASRRLTLDSEFVVPTLGRAREIVDWVRPWLPAELEWPHFELKTQMRMEVKLL